MAPAVKYSLVKTKFNLISRVIVLLGEMAKQVKEKPT